MRKYIFLLALLVFTSCHVVRFFTLNFAGIDDYRHFPAREVKKDSSSFRFHTTGASAIRLPKELEYRGSGKLPFDEFLEKHKTVAFLIIRNDTIQYEKYFNRYSEGSVVPSFSMAKSVVSALMGIAVSEGYIKSVDQPVTDYLPQLKNKKGFEKITLEHLLNMRSGIRYNEGYFNPFGDVAKYYYGTNINRYIPKLKLKGEPDKEFDYISVNTQLLGMVVEKATGLTLARYLQEKLWGPMGMEFDASWSMDSKRDSMIKAFCCLNARARDFAKLGRLYLNNGNWNGRQLVPEDWVRKSTAVTSSSKDYIYSYQWWHTVNYRLYNDTMRIRPGERLDEHWDRKKYLASPGPDFYADGFLGQFIYVYPAKKLIIVRLGKDTGGIFWPVMLRKIAEKI